MDNDKWVDENVKKVKLFNYSSNVSQLKKFTGTHPKVIQSRINSKNWTFDYDLSLVKKSVKDRFKTLMSSVFGINMDYKNYNIIKK